LRVYDPSQARALGHRLNDEAARLRRRMEAQLIDPTDAGKALQDARDQALEQTLEKPPVWAIDAKALGQLDAAEAARQRKPAIPDAGALAEVPGAEQWDALCTKTAAADREQLSRASWRSRLSVGFDLDGKPLGIANEASADAVMAFIYRAIAYRGASARLTAEDVATLRSSGRTPADLAIIRYQLGDLAKDEHRLGWRLGPGRDEISRDLVAAGISPSIENVHALRRQILIQRADILEELAAQPRLGTVPPAATPFAAPVTTDAGENAGNTAAPPPASIAAVVVPPVSPDPNLPVTATAPGEETPSFLKLVDDFLEKKAKNMGDHSRRQYRAAGRLFVKVAGTSDPRAMTQNHIGDYFDLLVKLPKSYGKSPADESRSVAELIQRGEDAVARSGLPRHDVIGLDPPTVNRHVTQLGAILKYARVRGYTIGDPSTLADMRERDPELDEDKRHQFSQSEMVTLFSSPVWTGCAGEDDRLSAGKIILHDSVYFGPLLACYELLGLSEFCEIMLDDVDSLAPIPSLEIRMNDLRVSLKTATRPRRLPIHPELLRLGFLDYAEALRRLGFKTLFPDLRLRGVATPMGNLFNKSWTPVLDSQLPAARENSQTAHSFRKSGNTVMFAGVNGDNPVARQIMGHKQITVNGRHYLAPFPDAGKLTELLKLPVVTADLRKFSIRLSQPVLDYAASKERDFSKLI
jgi:hypothetical protein